MYTLFICFFLAFTTPDSAAHLRMVSNVKGSDGSVLVALFNDERHFLQKAVAAKVIALAADSTTTVRFENMPPGEYAVSVIHDRNKNGKLDTSPTGFPKERFAFSNNAMGFFGSPAFGSAKVRIGDRPVEQVLRLRYY
jgi:uncharacterized protein (DUF2141 family)